MPHGGSSAGRPGRLLRELRLRRWRLQVVLRRLPCAQLRRRDVPRRLSRVLPRTIAHPAAAHAPADAGAGRRVHGLLRGDGRGVQGAEQQRVLPLQPGHADLPLPLGAVQPTAPHPGPACADAAADTQAHAADAQTYAADANTGRAIAEAHAAAAAAAAAMCFCENSTPPEQSTLTPGRRAASSSIAGEGSTQSTS